MVEIVCKTDKERISDLESAVNSIRTDVALIVDIMTTIKSGVKILFIIGVVGKWLASVAVGVGAAIALIVFLKTGKPPNWN